MNQKFTQISLNDLVVGEPLPTALYVYIDLKYLIFRTKGDVLDRKVFERLELRNAQNLFVRSNDLDKLQSWRDKIISQLPPLPNDAKGFLKVKKEIHREVLDIFDSTHPDQIIKRAIDISKKITEEVMRAPFSILALSQIQTFSSDVANHSTNVSILSSYLALQLGYSHIPILQHIATGGLLHDIGKIKVTINMDDPPLVAEKKLEAHPILGVELLSAQHSAIAKEVLLIVGQHHEWHDGTGYPRHLRGASIYDLAKIVSIANEFDCLVVNADGSLHERQKKAIKQLSDAFYTHKYDHEKYEKILKILCLGI